MSAAFEKNKSMSLAIQDGFGSTFAEYPMRGLKRLSGWRQLAYVKIVRAPAVLEHRG